MAPEIGFEGHVEKLDIDSADVAPRPFLENVDQEAAILLAADRAIGNQIAGLGVEQALASAGPIAPALIGDFDRFRGGALNDRDELHPLGAEFVAKETIDRAAMRLVGGVNRAKNIEFDAMLAQMPPAFQHEIEGSLTSSVAPISVVQFARSVYAETDKEVVLFEERAPRVVEQQAIGLEGLLHDLAG